MAENVVKLLKTQKGGVKVYQNGFTYVKNRSGSDKIYWKCEMRKCTANIITNLFTDIETLSVLSCSGEHNHEGMPMRAEVANKIYELKCKTSASPITKTCQIVQHHLASTSADISTNLPSKDALRQVVNREKKKAEECKSKWRNIRDNYMKNKKKKITGSNTSYSKYDDERLNFLSESYDEGESSSTYIMDNTTHDPIEISFECVKEEFDSSEDVPLSESPFVIGTSTSSNAEQNTTYAPIPTIVSATYDASQSLAPPQNFPVLEQNLIPPPKRPMKRKIDSIIDELKKDREERNVILQQLVTKATCPTGKSPIHNFFSSMADIVCNFPPEKIAEVRMKVCTMINDVEISVMRDRSQSGGSF